MPTNNKPHLVFPGDVFTKLTVVGFSHVDKRWRRFYRCKCECGNKVTVQGIALRSGNTKSCGCLVQINAERRRLPNDRGVINHIILQYKRHARIRGHSFRLSYDTVEELVRSACKYCGVKAGNLKKTKNFKQGFAHNGIDRIDSTKGYYKKNVVSACGFCNKAKRNMPIGKFTEWIKRIAAHNNP